MRACVCVCVCSTWRSSRAQDQTPALLAMKQETAERFAFSVSCAGGVYIKLMMQGGAEGAAKELQLQMQQLQAENQHLLKEAQDKQAELQQHYKDMYARKKAYKDLVSF